MVISYWLLVIITSITAIIFAKSTGALVGVGAGFFVMIILYILSSRGAVGDVAISPHGRRSPRSLWSLAMTIIAVLAALAVLAPTSIKNELLLRNWSGHVHKTQWVETIDMLKDNPILGAGLASYKETFTPYHKATYLEIFEYPHNLILNFWSEIGLLGLIAFLWLIIMFFRNVCQNYVLRPMSYVLVPTMITLLVHGLVDVPYFKNDLAVLFWIIYALGLTL